MALFWTNPSYPPNSFSLCPIPQCWVLPYNVSLIGQSRISDRRSRRRACTQQPRAPHPQFFKAPQISPLSYPSCFIFRVLVSLVLLTLLLPHLLEDAESTCACEIIDLQNKKRPFGGSERSYPETHQTLTPEDWSIQTSLPMLPVVTRCYHDHCFQSKVNIFNKVSIVKTSAHANSCRYSFLKRHWQQSVTMV